jgi:two-component system, OmpR family, response regulator VicR
MAGERVLIVDDERSISELVRDYLVKEGYQTRMEFDGKSALAAIRSWKPHLLILDIMLPALDGQEVCRLARAEHDMPILMLSARRDEVDKILSLGLGADDYVTKPFSPGELVARVRAHLRRYASGHLDPSRGASLSFGALSIDLEGRRVRLSGRTIDLSAREFDLLAFLARRPGQVFTRDQLFSQVWGENRFGDLKTVTVHVQRIREKLGEDSAAPRHIKTIWGVGYRFDA